jgi:hypothetical protein
MFCMGLAAPANSNHSIVQTGNRVLSRVEYRPQDSQDLVGSLSCTRANLRLYYTQYWRKRNGPVSDVSRLTVSSRFPAPLAIGLMFALIGNVCHFIMVGRLTSAGVRVKLFFLMPKEQFRIYSTYRFMATRENWSLWPLYGLWLALAGMLIAFIVLVSYVRT